MGRLIYSMMTSLDGFVADANGDFGWDVPEDEEVHRFVNDLTRSVGTYLYGRRMYETMVYWETAHTVPDQPSFVLDWARIWQAADKVVYSTTLHNLSSTRTRLERRFEPESVRRLKESAEHDLTVDGPGLAAHALRAGLVDEIHQILVPVVVGGGNPFFPDDVRLRLSLVDEHRFGNGVVHLGYRIEG